MAVVLWVGTAAVFPHLHSDLFGKEKEGCSPCFLRQAVQPLAETGVSLASLPLLEFPLQEPALPPILSQRTVGSPDNRAPPVIL